MLVNIDEEKIEFYDLPLGAVFDHNGITYMKINAIEFDSEDEEHLVPAVLNLATLLVEYFSWDLKIPARFVFKPTEITFK